ncbi:hypothetical protein ACIPSA_41490 [Streptomyces sp. NPDC086549]|uniref:hypothetical protein n=1 Tax=Streptomyces sp. NPDC086549 TaxID=3365752 RepID=UPI00382CC536
MALIRPGLSVERPAPTAAADGSGPSRAAQAYAEVPPPVGVALRAMRLEALLGDPHDPANPYGQPALWAAGRGSLPEPPADLPAVTVPRPGGARPAADQLARILRPVFRRDLALGHAWGIRPLLDASDPAAALLGPAALIAATGGVLRTVTRIVDGLSRHEPGVGQWRPVLAATFADLLACESLTAVALRSVPWTQGAAGGACGLVSGDAVGPMLDGSSGLVAAVGYVVPQLVGELLDDLELVLNECGFRADSPERRTLAKLAGDRAQAQVDWTAAAAWQARVVRGLAGLTDPARHGEHPELRALFRLADTSPVDVGTGQADCHGAVAATLTGATARLAGDGDSATAALARVGRRLVTEQRALRVACGPTASHDPADPVARALADRQALLLLAASVLGVREAAAEGWVRFLGGPDWALLALSRITDRLGAPRPGAAPDPQAAVWAELAERSGHGVDCDVYATQLLW